MNKRLIALVISAATLSLGLYWWVSNKPSGYGFEEQYALSKSEISNLEERARRGQCEAARRLASYYLNVVLNFEAGLRWSRLAARCPDVSDKRQLLVLLVQLPRTAGTDAEIEKTVEQISELSPKEGERVRKMVNEERVPARTSQ